MGLRLLLVGALALVSVGCGYNEIQARDETVKAAWSEVTNQYQRRADLIPNLVNTVKGAADFEQETLTAVIEARARATSVKLSPELLEDQAAFDRFVEAQGQVSSALSRLFAVAENYPTLKASDAFRDLQAQIEGTENRITVARGRFIDAVREFNTLVRSFPTLITAKVTGAGIKPTFQAREGVGEVPPEVKF